MECTSPPCLWLKSRPLWCLPLCLFHIYSGTPSDSKPGEVSTRCRAERRRRGRLWTHKSAKALVLLLNCPIYNLFLLVPVLRSSNNHYSIFYCFIWCCCQLFVTVAFRLVVVFVILQINPCDQHLQPPTMDHHLQVTAEACMASRPQPPAIATKPASVPNAAIG